MNRTGKQMREMFWTKTKPDRPGWWWADFGDGSPAVVYVRYATVPNNLGFWWAGVWKWVTDVPRWSTEPWPEPSEPPEHPDIQELRAEIATFGTMCTWGSPAESVTKKQEKMNALADKLQAALSAKDAT